MTFDKDSGQPTITQYSSREGIDHSKDPLWSCSDELLAIASRISEVSQWIESQSDELKNS